MRWALITRLALCLLPGTALAAASGLSYPLKPIRIVVASAPGSGPDIVTRLLGRKLTDAWSQQIIADNRAGAGGNVGAEIVAHAPADGYTLLMATASQPIGAALYTKLNYDLVRDFAPVSLIASTPFMLVVNPAVPATSVNELIADVQLLIQRELIPCTFSIYSGFMPVALTTPANLLTSEVT